MRREYGPSGARYTGEPWSLPSERTLMLLSRALPAFRRPLCALLLSAAITAGASEPVPTVVVDIHAIGADALAALKAEHGVIWSAEFGNELLLGVDPAQMDEWLARPRVSPGLGRLSPETIWVRDHVCTHQAQQPALGVVGGYEIVRQPASVVRYAARSGAVGMALPKDGVLAREVHNQDGDKSVAAALPSVQAIVDRVDAERWFGTMSSLASFNRNSFSPALGAARNAILAHFDAIGLQTQVFAYTLANLGNCGTPSPPPIEIDNPIGIKIGEALPDEWIVVGAHYDSRNSARCDGTVAPQPGANDNASGCAGVIELARVYADVPTRRSILFMCFSGEEQGLWGSRRYVESLQASGEISKVRHMINLDMIGFDPSGPLDARIETNAANLALLAQYAAAAATYAPELNLITSSNTGAYSDHWYFLAAGVPSMFTWENGASIYPHYHQSTDVPANMTRARELAGGILKMDAAILAQVAGIGPLFGDGFE